MLYTDKRKVGSRWHVVWVLSMVMMAAMVVLAGACGTQGSGTQQVGKMQHDSKSVDPEDARSARAQLKMGAGELNLTGGADRLMDADFSYNVSDWKPRISYDVSGKKGELVVKQGSAEGGGLSGGARNEWDVSLNDKLPTDLVVQLGAGESDLDLDSLTLKIALGACRFKAKLGEVDAWVPEHITTRPTEGARESSRKRRASRSPRRSPPLSGSRPSLVVYPATS